MENEEKININKEISNTKSPVVDILVSQRADPYIVKGTDGYYYFTGSYPMLGENDSEGYDRVILRRSKTIEDLKAAEEITIWDEKNSRTSFRFIWAPEMHNIGGVWYVLSTIQEIRSVSTVNASGARNIHSMIRAARQELELLYGRRMDSRF